MVKLSLPQDNFPRQGKNIARENRHRISILETGRSWDWSGEVRARNLICRRKPVKFHLLYPQGSSRTMCIYPMDSLILCVLWVDLLTHAGALPSVIVSWCSESSRRKALKENNEHWQMFHTGYIRGKTAGFANRTVIRVIPLNSFRTVRGEDLDSGDCGEKGDLSLKRIATPQQ